MDWRYFVYYYIYLDTRKPFRMLYRTTIVLQTNCTIVENNSFRSMVVILQKHILMPLIPTKAVFQVPLSILLQLEWLKDWRNHLIQNVPYISAPRLEFWNSSNSI
jgi:hypothetical protein